MSDEMVVEAIRAALAINPVMDATPVNQVTEANPAVVERFQQAMQAADVSPAQLVPPPVEGLPIPFAGRVEQAFKTAQDCNQGIMQRIHTLSDKSSGTLTMAELMELQYKVANLSFQQELVTKVIDRASQAVQTLIKNQ